MSEIPHISPEAEAELCRESDRAFDAFVAFVTRYPQFVKHAACALLGTAVGTCDMVGEDAEGFIRHLREKTAKPEPLVPPTEPPS